MTRSMSRPAIMRATKHCKIMIKL